MRCMSTGCCRGIPPTSVAAAAVHPLLLLAFIVDDGPLSLEGFSITAMPAFLFAWILGTAMAMPRKD